MLKRICNNSAFVLGLYGAVNYDLKDDAWSVANAVRHILYAVNHRSKDANALIFFIDCFFEGRENHLHRKYLRDPEIEHAFQWLLYAYNEEGN